MTKLLTLAEMVDALKAEVGFSLVPSHGLAYDSTLKYLIKRTQDELYEAYDWPVLTAWDFSSEVKAGTTVAGPFTSVSPERINNIYAVIAATYQELLYGIDPQLMLVNRKGPPIRYRYGDDPTTLVVWPEADADYKLLALGTRPLQPLVDDGDRSTLDGTLIVLFAATEILTRNKADDAALKLQKAQAYLNSLLKQQGANKRVPQSMVPSRPNGGRRPVPFLEYIPYGYGPPSNL